MNTTEGATDGETERQTQKCLLNISKHALQIMHLLKEKHMGMRA